MSIHVKRMFVSVWTGLLLFPCLAPAADEAEAAQLTSLQDIIEAGGWPMKVIIALSIIAIFLVIFFLFTLRANALYPKAFIREAEDAAEEGDIEALEAICQDNDSAAAHIIGAAAEQIAGEQRTDYMILRDAIEDAGARQAGVLWQRIQWLQDIAVVAPMVGLLGTVLGMLQAFAGVQAEIGIVKPTALAQGVAKALITTAGGLIVGIGAMILYALFRGWVNKLTGGLEHACGRVLRRLIAKRQVGQY